MRKNVRVNYPKKKDKLDATKLTGVQEPCRKTLYDTALENFRTVNRATYIHRIIYAGEHFFPKSDDLITDVFRTIIEQVNDDYNLEKLTGLFIHYNKYFFHMVEGDEDAMNKHIRILLYGHEYTKYLGTIKLIIHVAHVSRRMMSTWNSLYGIPAKLLGELDINSSLEDSGRRIYSCIKKIYHLASVYSNQNSSFHDSDSDRWTIASKADTSSDESERRAGSQNRISNPSSAASSSGVSMAIGTSIVTKCPYRPFLPEIELLDFILRSPFTKLLEDYYACYGVVPQRDINKDKVWPIPSDYIPYDILQKADDMITELPKPKSQSSDDKRDSKAEKARRSSVENVPRHISFFERASAYMIKRKNKNDE